MKALGDATGNKAGKEEEGMRGSMPATGQSPAVECFNPKQGQKPNEGVGLRA